jgi:branched-chain amino acid transport system ATP-binding protein
MPLEIKRLRCGYGRADVLHDVDLTVAEGSIVALIGSNGAGTSTLMRCVAGQLRPSAGEVRFFGERLKQTPTHRRVAHGLALVPEGRHVFADMTVLENLRMGQYSVRKSARQHGQQLDLVFDMFPRLRERSKQSAGTLSGGEQQMLAIGRGLLSQPKLLLLDEPSLGLAPRIVHQILQSLVELNGSLGLSILLVEQNARLALAIAHHAYVLESGRVVHRGTGQELLDDPRVQNAYLNIATEEATINSEGLR